MIAPEERTRREAIVAQLNPRIQHTDPEVYDRITSLYLDGQLNDFTYERLAKNIAYFVGQEGMVENAIEDMLAATAAGVNDGVSYGMYFMATQDVPDIMYALQGRRVPSEQQQGVVSRIYQKLLGLRQQGETVPAGGLREMVEEEMGMPEKKAYPQGYDTGFILPQYDMSKWMRATRGIYAEMQQKGKTFAEAEAQVTGQWEKREQQDFQDWLNYYREEVPKKYPKLAQKYYESNTPGYFIPNFDSLKSHIPKPVTGVETNEQERVREQREKEQSDREMIEAQRSKIISRLNAAEKLLASLDGQMFAGDEQEFMLKLLQELKRKVQTANKITVRSSLFEDLIHREANRLESYGRTEPADFIRKVAQGVGGLDPFADPTLMGAPPMGGGVGAPQPQQQTPVDPAVAKRNTKKLMTEVEVRLDSGGVADPDVLKREEKRRGIKEEKAAPSTPAPAPIPEVPPPPPPEEEKKPEKKEKPPAPSGEEELEPSPAEKKAEFRPDIVVVAQPAPPPAPPLGEAETDAPGRPVAPGPAPAVPAPVEAPTEEHTEDVIDAALRNLTVDDVIARLEVLTGMYKKREISRQLSILDIMMDRLGIGSYFPELGEAMAKALESNQYISTRLEGALSRLKGSVENPEVAKIMETRETPTPQTQGIRNTLDMQKKKEEERKEKRREREMAKLEAPPGGAPPAAPAAPLGGAAGELGGPARVAPPRPPVAGLR